MDIKNQIKQFNKIIHKLYLEKKWETSKLSRLLRAIRFHLGISQCRYCVYFQPEYGDHQARREESILTKGKCGWSDMTGAEIDKKMATKLKRCSAFVPALFNIKGYSISKEETKDILLQRRNYFFAWGAILIAIIAATISWTQTKEVRKERIEAENAFKSAQEADRNAKTAAEKAMQSEKNIEKITKEIIQIMALSNAVQGRFGSEEDFKLKRKWYTNRLDRIIGNFNFTGEEKKEIYKFSEKFDELDKLFEQRDELKSTDPAYGKLTIKIEKKNAEITEMFRKDIQN